MRRTLFLLVALAALTACNPRLYPPQVETPDNYLYAGRFRQDSLAGSEEWWHVFRDPTLDSLISQALANNRDLAVAYSRVEEADRQIAVARAGFLPSFGVGVSAEGDYNAETKIVQKYAVEPQMTWEVSLFGALRNSTRAARAELLSSQWALRGVMLSLTAEVATTYFQLLGYRRNLRIAERSYALRRESAALIDSMYRHGMANGVALQQARSLVYTAAADIPTYRRAVAQMQLTLCTLLGENPQRPQDVGAGVCLMEDYRPVDVPVGLPSELLERRPDIMEAYYNMEAAAYKARYARSVRFPSIALTGAGGVAGNTLKEMTSGKPRVWSAVGQITQPLFAFGKLKRTEQAAVEVYKQQVYAYEQTVIEAFADVEKALVSIETYRKQATRQAQLVLANSRISEMNRELYRNGMSAYLDVIDAERELYASQMQFVEIAVQQYVNYVGLYKALGGGW